MNPEVTKRLGIVDPRDREGDSLVEKRDGLQALAPGSSRSLSDSRMETTPT
jgi:hypothetical protein